MIKMRWKKIAAAHFLTESSLLKDRDVQMVAAEIRLGGGADPLIEISHVQRDEAK